MADFIQVTQGSGATIATDQAGGAHYQRIKITDGTADSENHWTINSSNEGLVKVNAALPIGANYIGLATVNIGSSNATLYAVEIGRASCRERV